MRYFLTLSYLGTRFCGWQIQPAQPSIQESLETALSTLLRDKNIEVTGCGRTDTGVHARNYIAHFDTEKTLPDRFLWSLNSLLPFDIAVQALQPMHPDAHARYDAFERAYRYTITLEKDPFRQETAWFLPQIKPSSIERLQETADLIGSYGEFFPFCKTHSSARSYACQMKQAQWTHEGALLYFDIRANRFLRGMVRLIVGACMQVADDKLQLETVRNALERQEALPKSYSVPAQGLALTDVRYPYPIVDDAHLKI